MSHAAPTLVSGDEALANFRRGLTGRYAHELLLEADGRLLIQLPVGVGKTEWLVKIIQHVVETRHFDLVIVLFPRRDIINEFTARLPECVDRVVLRPRPKDRCGDLNSAWLDYEKSNCGVLGRQELCESCAHRTDCFWPEQFGDHLRNVEVVIATQQHAVLDPNFVDRIASYSGAEKPLVLQDESDLLLKNTSRNISRDELIKFTEAIETVSERTSERWSQYLELLQHADSNDLQGDWNGPRFTGQWARQVQHAGWQLYGDQFRFLGYILNQFGRSRQSSREALADGSIRFSSTPSLGDNFIIFTGSMAPTLVRYRLDPEFTQGPVWSPMSHYRFRHPGTTWFNIGNIAGAAKYFRKNSPAILDFFAAMVARNIRNGLRTLLICKQRFVNHCSSQIETRVRGYGTDCRVITSNWQAACYDAPTTVPLIHFGISGLNLFEHFDAAYSLTGYYINNRVLTDTVHDLDRSADRYEIKINATKRPHRRVAVVETDAQTSILPLIAQESLDQLEGDVIVQAVGRVRPMTRPREVITFHAGQLPGITLDRNFDSLGQARGYFGVPTSRRRQLEERQARAQALRNKGVTPREIAKKLDLSERTVRRYIANGRRT
tara:strand:+ start:147710 stop:149530 length:1821 start_codon:yes stop_codon:yes gene_type:complete